MGLVVTSSPYEGQIVKAATGTTSQTITDGEYTTGVFAGKYGIDQLFDYIMSSSRLNSLAYDASWGYASSSTGHQLTTSIMKDRHFVLKYSGDANYPIALCLYEDDDTPVVAGRSGGLLYNSRIGLSTNVCLTTNAKTYMEKTYADGYEGVMAVCEMGKADENGLYFSSSNGFGYYLSGNQGRGVGEYITWVNADTNVTVEELSKMTKYSSQTLELGEYAVLYKEGTEDVVYNMPEEQKKTGREDLTLSKNVPTRKGYRFANWNTRKDGTGTSYQPGDTYNVDEMVTLYATWTRYYEAGLFGAKFGQNQLFDDITSGGIINGNPYDSSWGYASASTGHHCTNDQMEGRYFVFRYTGDSSYPVGLFMYEKDGTPVVAGVSDHLFASSRIGLSNNVCLTTTGKTYMEKNYRDGIKGLMCQGKVNRYDANGVEFISINTFGYYISANRGCKTGDHVTWTNPVTSVTVNGLDAMDTFSDAIMSAGEYAIIYNANASDLVTSLPATQRKEDLYGSMITTQQPVRAGYRFTGWSTSKDGAGSASGTSYSAGSRYTGTGVLTLYATWEKDTKSNLILSENGTEVSKTYNIQRFRYKQNLQWRVLECGGKNRSLFPV